MKEFYVVYRSITHAQQAQKALARQGVKSTLLRTPKSVSKAGCSYSLRLTEREFQRARPHLSKYVGIFIRQAHGELEETRA